MIDEENLPDVFAGLAPAAIAASDPNRTEHESTARQPFQIADSLTRQRKQGERLPLPTHQLEEVFSRRTANALNSAGTDSWEDLQRSTPVELLRIRDFGQVCLAEVREELAAHRLRLRGDC